MCLTSSSNEEMTGEVSRSFLLWGQLTTWFCRGRCLIEGREGHQEREGERERGGLYQI